MLNHINSEQAELANSNISEQVYSSIPSLIDALTPLSAEDQCEILSKLPITLITSSNPIANILNILTCLHQSSAYASLKPIIVLEESLISNNRIIVPPKDIAEILYNNAYDQQFKIKVLYLFRNIEALKNIQHSEDILAIELALLFEVEKTLNMTKSQWANSLDLPANILTLKPMMALEYLRNLQSHDINFITESFISALTLKCDADIENYRNILIYCMQQLNDHNQRLCFLADTKTLEKFTKNSIKTLNQFINLMELDWTSTPSSISEDQLRYLLQMKNFLHYIPKEQQFGFMALPCVLTAIDNIPDFDREALSAYLKLMPDNIVKRHVWRCSTFDFEFLMNHVRNLDNIDWRIAFRSLTKNMMDNLLSQPDLFCLIPEKDHANFILGSDLLSTELTGRKENYVCCETFSDKYPQHASFLSLHALLLVTPAERDWRSPYRNTLSRKLEKIKHPGITYAAFLYYIRFDSKPNLPAEYRDYDDLDRIMSKVASFSLPQQPINDLLSSENDKSDLILREVIAKLNKGVENYHKAIELILFIEEKITELNKFYLSQNKLFNWSAADMYGLEKHKQPKIQALRYTSSHLVLTHIIRKSKIAKATSKEDTLSYYRVANEAFNDLLEAFLATEANPALYNAAYKIANAPEMNQAEYDKNEKAKSQAGVASSSSSSSSLSSASYNSTPVVTAGLESIAIAVPINEESERPVLSYPEVPTTPAFFAVPTASVILNNEASTRASYSASDTTG